MWLCSLQVDSGYYYGGAIEMSLYDVGAVNLVPSDWLVQFFQDDDSQDAVAAFSGNSIGPFDDTRSIDSTDAYGKLDVCFHLHLLVFCFLSFSLCS